MAIELTPTLDDRTPPEMIGYLVVITSGSPPSNLIPEYAIRAQEGNLYLHWRDGNSPIQEPLGFVFTVTAIDLGGNQSEPSEPVVIGENWWGCNAKQAGDYQLGNGALVLLVLMLLTRRSRRAPASWRDHHVVSETGGATTASA